MFDICCSCKDQLGITQTPAVQNGKITWMRRFCIGAVAAFLPGLATDPHMISLLSLLPALYWAWLMLALSMDVNERYLVPVCLLSSVANPVGLWFAMLLLSSLCHVETGYDLLKLTATNFPSGAACLELSYCAVVVVVYGMLGRLMATSPSKSIALIPSHQKRLQFPWMETAIIIGSFILLPGVIFHSQSSADLWAVPRHPLFGLSFSSALYVVARLGVKIVYDSKERRSRFEATPHKLLRCSRISTLTGMASVKH